MSSTTQDSVVGLSGPADRRIYDGILRFATVASRTRLGRSMIDLEVEQVPCAMPPAAERPGGVCGSRTR